MIYFLLTLLFLYFRYEVLGRGAEKARGKPLQAQAQGSLLRRKVVALTSLFDPLKPLGLCPVDTLCPKAQGIGPCKLKATQSI